MAATNTGGYTTEYDLPNQSNSTNYVYNEIGELIENKQENQGFEYNASGLTTRVYNVVNNNNIATFTYNDKGLRHSKTSYNTSGVAIKATYYSYDAGGAQVATYTKDLVTSGATTQLQDFTLYGMGRLGVYDAINTKALYELSDHLGNTRAIITKNTSTGLAETVSYTDYYPHGGVMPGRNYVNSLNFPFAYQGQEKDAETNLINFELRQYDARLGRWYNPDPMKQHHSPYLAMGNNPISMIDPDGGLALNSGYGDDDAMLDARFNHGGTDQQSFDSWMSSFERSEVKSLLKHDIIQYNSNRKRAREEEQNSDEFTRSLNLDYTLPEVTIDEKGYSNYDVHGFIDFIIDNLGWYENSNRDFRGYSASQADALSKRNRYSNKVPVQDIDMGQSAKNAAIWKQYGRNYNDLADFSEKAVIGTGVFVGAVAGGFIVAPYVITAGEVIVDAQYVAHSYANVAYNNIARKTIETVGNSLIKNLPRSVVNSPTFNKFFEYMVKNAYRNKDVLKDGKKLFELYRNLNRAGKLFD